MRLDENPVDESNVENEFLDVGATSIYPLPKRAASASQSSSEGELTDIDDIDAEQSDPVVDFIPLEMDKKLTEGLSDGGEEGKKKTYDREAMLKRLANLAKLEGNRGQMILEIAGLKFGTTPTKFAQVSDIEKMTAEEQQKKLVDDLRETLRPVPDSMLHYVSGFVIPGDCGRPSDQKPDWLDMEKLRRGQKFAQDYSFPILYSEVIGVLAVYSFVDGLKPLIITGNSDTPHKAFKRYISTIVRCQRWYAQDTWTKGTAAWNDIMVVRAMHNAVSRRLQSSTKAEIDAATKICNAKCLSRDIVREDFADNCKAPVIGQCPYIVMENNSIRANGINQTEMGLTQWAFVGLIITYPEKFGIHNATDEDIEAFCHLWKSLGYQLGIEDEYNFCRGTLEEIRERGRDFVEAWVKPNLREITPEWEHMGRCLIGAVNTMMPVLTYEATLLHFFDIMGLQMPRLYASLPYKDRIVYSIFRSLMFKGTKIPGVTSFLNIFGKWLINRAANITPEQHKAFRIKLDSEFN